MADLNPIMRLKLRTQSCTEDEGGHAVWQVAETPLEVPARSMAIIICDMWDLHWSRGATERVGALAEQINTTITAARARGVTIIHGPADVTECYAATPARQRALDVPQVVPPPTESAAEDDPPLPIDDSDGGSDTGEREAKRVWNCQHPSVRIDQEQDFISEDGCEIYSLLRHRAIRLTVIMGVHTNMCMLNRPYGIKQMVRWGVSIALARDLTDAIYNPAMPPYVNHDEGTRLVVEYIEKFWCPTVAGGDVFA